MLGKRLPSLWRKADMWRKYALELIDVEYEPLPGCTQP